MRSIPLVAVTLLRIIGALSGSLFVGYLGWLVIRGWFGGEGPANLGSIEVSYVSMGRFLVDYGWKSWAPFWYFGFPFHLFYTPLLPVLEWLLKFQMGMPLWEAYRFVTGWSYILAPVSAFFLGWVLSRRWIGGLVAGVFYSIGPTVFYWLEKEVLADRFFSPGGVFLDPRRFVILVRWGEGPHLLSLVFLPLAGAFFVQFLRRSRFFFLVAGAVSFGLASLSNALGFMGTLLLVASIAFVRHAQYPKERTQIVRSSLAFFLIGFGLMSFWYNLSFLTNFFAEGGTTQGMLLSLFPWGWLVGIFGIGILYVVFGKILRNFGVAVSLIWFLTLFTVVYVYYASAPGGLSALRIELLPQALRYMTQVDLAFSVLLGAVVGGLLRKDGRRFIIAEIICMVFVMVLLLVSLSYVRPFIPLSFEASSKVVDLSTSHERVIADWLSSHVDVTKGERVFLPGNYGFFLNWFSDVWQLRGGLFQASTHFWPDHIHYQMANGEDSEIAMAWLKVSNAKYAVVTGPGSSELYREMKHLERFEGLRKAYTEDGDIIYEVPLVRPSTAKPVDAKAMSGIATPIKADDKEALLSYVDWVERSSGNELEFRMIDNDTYEVKGNLDAGEVILVQMTADPGWRAYLRQTAGQGKPERIRTGRDPLGFLMLYPDIPLGGEVEITLKHGLTWQQWLGYLITLAAVVGIGWYGVKSLKFHANGRAGKVQS